MITQHTGQAVVPGTGDFLFLTGGGLLVALLGLAAVLFVYCSDEPTDIREGEMLAAFGMMVMGIGVSLAGLVLHTTTEHDPASWIAAIIGLAGTAGGWRMMVVGDRKESRARARRWSTLRPMP